MKTKETNPTRPGSRTPCKQALRYRAAAICADILRAALYFSAPRRGAGKNTSNERNVRSYYMLNHRKEVYYSTTKKSVILQLASIVFGKSI